MGITEPAMYGVNMRLKKPFAAALIGGAAGGAFYGMTGVASYIVGGMQVCRASLSLSAQRLFTR